MKERTREFAIALATTDLHILLEKIKDLKINLSLELQAARDDRRAQEKQFREFMSELWGTLRKIQAQFRIDATLLHLIEPEKAAKQGPHGKNEETLPDWH
jgi:hypothetical protein